MAAEPAWHDVLRTLRERRDISQEGWAARLGYSRRTVQRWESGHLIPDAAAEDALLGLCAELGLLRADGQNGSEPGAAELRGLLAAARVPNDGSAATAAQPQGAESPATPTTEDDERLHLPMPLTSLLGREREVAAVAALLETARLVTLTGPGGTGKTRLAIAVARQAAEGFPDGVWFVDLSAVTDPAAVLPPIALALDVRESDGRSLAVSLAAYLRRKRLLLLLDNFEQVVAAAVTLYDLLRDAPGVAMLVTSRVLLRIEGEHEYAVPPLPLPAQDAEDDLAALSASPAVDLFLDRARALRPEIEANAATLRAIGAICVFLDGLPLAIELAAARVRLLSPAQLLSRLERRLPLLTGGERSSPQRQQTLRNTIQWSWDLLSADEQTLFRRLAVFAGGFSLVAAEIVCNPDGTLDVLEALSALVDHSLVRRREDESGQPRFSLLATLQEYAQEQLEATGEIGTVRRAHARYFTALAEAADAAWWRSGRLVLDLLRPLDPERDNLLAALAQALSERDTITGFRLGGALGMWFYCRAPGEGQQLLERVLNGPGAAELSVARGHAFFSAGLCVFARGGWQHTVPYLEEAARCFRAAGELPALSRTLALLSDGLPATEAKRALVVADEALRVAEALGDSHEAAFAVGVVGQAIAAHDGDQATAHANVEEALRLARALQADWLTMWALMYMGHRAADDGRLDEAQAQLQQVVPLAEAVGDLGNVATISMRLGELALRIGDLDAASAHCRRVLRWAREHSSTNAMASCLANVAWLLAARQRPELAVQLLAVSAQVRSEMPLAPFFEARFQAALTEGMVTAEVALSVDAFAEAWAAGEALSLDEATDLALAELAAIERGAAGASTLAGM